MGTLRLRDNRNRFGDNGLFFKNQEDGSFVSDPANTEGLGNQRITDDERKILEWYGDKTLGELASLSNGAIVDLSGSHLDEEGRRKLHFFEYIGKGEDGFRLDTDNLMGVLRFRDRERGTSIQVEILSRFDKGENNFFLNYLLARAFDFAQGVEAISAQRSSILEILLDAIFVRRLGEAARAGLLRHYREFRNNDWAFKGSLDLPRHILENMPLPHGIAYVKREIDLDVPVNRMILMTALRVKRRNPNLFKGNADASDALRQLRMGVTEERDIPAVLSHRDCREPVAHPFFREVWEPLRRIARMILEGERWTLFSEGGEEEEVSGIVFDGSWLWEEYLAAVLEPAGFRHFVRGEGNGLPVFKDERARFYPDFCRESADPSGRVVLDAKYKRFNPNGERNDVHQVLCYLLLTGAKYGGLVFPPCDDRAETKDDQDAFGNAKVGEWSPQKEIKSPYSTTGAEIFWRCFSWAPIPSETNMWSDFVEYMKTQESELKKMPFMRVS